MNKGTLFEKEEEVMRVFLLDFYSIKEASHKYDPELPEKARNHRTVTHYYYPFKKKGWFESAMISRKKNKGGRATWERYRLNFNFYFELRGYKFITAEDKKIKSILNDFLSQQCVRDQIAKSKMGLLESIDQLLFIMHRLSNEHYYNEFIEELFPNWDDLVNSPDFEAVVYKNVPKKQRVNAMLWKFAFDLIAVNKDSKLLIKKNPLLSRYEDAHGFLFAADKGKFFDKWRKTSKPIKNRVN